MADQDYGVFTPQDCQRIWKAVMAFERMNPPDKRIRDIIDHTPIYYRNDSGETIPAYSIMQIDTTVEDADKNYISVVKPITWQGPVVGPFLFSGTREVAKDKYGVAQSGPVYKVKKDGSALVVGDRLGPKDDQWTISKGSMYTILGLDALEPNLVKVVDNHTPMLGITYQEIPGNGEGQVFKKDPTSGDWENGLVLYDARNPSETAIPADTLVILFPIDAKWAAVAIC